MATTLTRQITFGDCDPAGIVYYPNVFRWMDATFHLSLRPFGGHAELCRRFGSIGLGLVDSSAQFRHAMRDGDMLAVRADVAAWSRKSMTLRYEGRVGDRLAFEGREVRCMFLDTGGELAAGDLAGLRGILEGGLA